MEHSAGFVLFREVGSNRYYLIMHYRAGHWDFPKGHIEKGESKEETAKRELKEETGISGVEIIPGFEHEYIYEFGKKPKKKRVTFMLAKTSQSRTKLSHEHTGARWVTYENALKMVTFENAKKMLAKAQGFLEGKEAIN